MTAPAPLTSVQRHADDLQTRLRGLADATAEDVSAVLAARVAAARADITGLYVREFGGIDRMPETLGAASRFAGRARARMSEALNPGVLDDGALAEAIRTAHGMGADHALDTTPVLPSSLPVLAEPELPDLGRLVREQTAEALSHLSDAAVHASGFTAVGVAGVKAERAVHRVDATTAWEITRAASDGVRDVAEQADAGVVWVAERDGCLHCLAYAGQTTAATGVFPGGLTFADRALTPLDPFTGPPLHPRCRCTLEVWHHADTAVVEALKREAKRSVLRGEALDGGPARLRAADRLLTQGSGLAKTVEDRARTAVRRGEFPDRPRRARQRDDDPADLDLSRDRKTVRQAQAEPTPVERTPVGILSDDDLDAAMQAAIEADDFDLVDEITAELDRRDAATVGQDPTDDQPEPAPADDWGTAWGHGLDEGDDTASDPEDLARLDTVAALIEQGYPEAEAYVVAYGGSVDDFRRQEAIARLRERYSGKGFDDLARQSYRDHVYEQWLAAEEETRGVLLNHAGKRAKIDPLTLFSGPHTRAAKYASDELKDWWEENERVTFEEWKAQLLGDGAALNRARFSGSGRRFER